MSIKAFPPWTPQEKCILLATFLVIMAVLVLLGHMAQAEMATVRR
jgi:hypothetical protein